MLDTWQAIRAGTRIQADDLLAGASTSQWRNDDARLALLFLPGPSFCRESFHGFIGQYTHKNHGSNDGELQAVRKSLDQDQIL
jgi:hypothetical protein